MVPEHSIQIIDTIGFGDLRVPEEHVDDIVTQIITNMIRFDDSGTNAIDAFVLVSKCTPRAATLKNDLDHLMNLFGSVALQSTVILLIPAEKELTEDRVAKEFMNMEEVIRMMKTQRTDKPENWFVHWDNFKPKPNQLQKLLNIVATLKPYVSIDYLNSRP